MSDILDEKIKQNKLANKYGIPNLVEHSDVKTKLATLATKAELQAQQEKPVKQQAHDLISFFGKNFSDDDGSPNIFVYQPTLDTLELKKTSVIMFLARDQVAYMLILAQHKTFWI